MSPHPTTPAAPRATTDEAQAELRAKVLQAALAVLTVRGFDGARLRDVATKAGVSIGLLQHYFGTRDELMLEALRAGMDERREEWLRTAEHAAGASDDAWGRLMLLMHAAIRDANSRTSASTWIEFCAAATRHPELRAAMHEIYNDWRRPVREAIAAGIASGEFQPDADVAIVVDALLSQIDGCAMAAAMDLPSLSTPQARQVLLKTAAGLLGVAPD